MSEPADPFGALHATAARYRGGFEAAAVPMCIGDMDLTVVTANPAMLALLGWQHDEVRGRAWTAFTHPDDLARGRELFEELRRGRRRSYRHEKRYLTRSGGSIWVRATVSAVLDTAGRPFLFIEVAEDLTERRAREAALGEDQRRFRAVFDQSAHGAALLTPDGTVIEANRACLALAGRPRDEVVGRPLWEVGDWGRAADVAAALGADIGRCRDGGEVVRRELAVAEAATGDDGGRGGATAVLDLVLTPVRGDDGAVALLLAEAHDVTARRRAEGELRERADEPIRSRAALLDQLGLAVLALDRPDRVRYWNPAAERLSRRAAADVLGRTVTELDLFDGWSGVFEQITRRLDEGERWTGRLLAQRRDGSTLPVFASVAAVTDAAGRKVGVVGALMEFAGPLSLPGLPALGAPSEDNLRAAARLTPRQFDVLGLIMRGYANKRIARELGVETGTVRMHVNAILKTLDVRNRTEAALIGTQLALSGPPELAARLRGGR